LHPTDIGIVAKLGKLKALLVPALTESFESDIEPDLTAELKTIDNRFRNVKDWDRDALNVVEFDPLRKRPPGHVGNCEGEERFLGRPGLTAVEGDPNLMWKLSGQLVKA